MTEDSGTGTSTESWPPLVLHCRMPGAGSPSLRRSSRTRSSELGPWLLEGEKNGKSKAKPYVDIKRLLAFLMA